MRYGVSQLACTPERISQAMHRSMEKAKSDPRVPKALWGQMTQVWVSGYGDAGWVFDAVRQWRL